MGLSKKCCGESEKVSELRDILLTGYNELVGIPVLIAFLFIILSTFGALKVDLFSEDLQNGIFFGVLTTPNSPRQHFAYDEWIKKVNQMHPHLAAFIVDTGHLIPDAKYIVRDRPEFFINIASADIDRSLKRYLGAYYFIMHTNLKWYWCASDDNSIDVNKIDAMAYELEKNYDTEKDVVYQGHCIYANNAIYLQGGIGYVYSRRAARMFIEAGINLIASCNTFDDMYFGIYKKIFGLKYSEIGTPFLYGHVFPNANSADFVNSLQKCPERSQIPQTLCYRDNIYSLKDIVGFHQSNTDACRFHFGVVKDAAKKYDNIYFYHGESIMHFCIMNESNITSIIDRNNKYLHEYH